MSAWLLIEAREQPLFAAMGIAFAAATAFLFRLVLPAPHPPDRTGSRSGNWVRRTAALLVFLPRFGWTVFLSGLHIARLALKPTLDFWPGIVRIRGGLPNRTATTVFAHLITLTPGTVAMDYDEVNDALYVHWIDVAEEDDEVSDLDRHVSGGMRPWIRRLFE